MPLLAQNDNETRRANDNNEQANELEWGLSHMCGVFVKDNHDNFYIDNERQKGAVYVLGAPAKALI